MDAIVAVDRDFGIGREGGMLYHLPGDLKYFKRMTLGKTLVMGRATLESLPGGRPLPGRETLVLSRREGYEVDGARVVRSLGELARAISWLNPEDVMLCGGGQLYHRLIDCCQKAYVTKIDAQAPSDTFFPNLDARENWALESSAETMEENGLRYAFCVYRNLNVKPLNELAIEEGEEA